METATITPAQALDSLLAVLAHAMTMQTRCDLVAEAMGDLDHEDRRLLADRHPDLMDRLLRLEYYHQDRGGGNQDPRLLPPLTRQNATDVAI